MVISLAHCLDYSIIAFSLLAPFSLWWSHPCAGFCLFVISGSNNFFSLASPTSAYPHPAHKPSFSVRRLLPPSSATSKHLCYFLLGLGRNSLLKMCNTLSLSPSLCFWKDSPLNTAGQNLVSSCWTLFSKMTKTVLCSYCVSVSGSSFSCLCCKQGLQGLCTE